MGNKEIYSVDDPTTDKSAASKQYVDNKKAFFEDGITTTEGIDLRNMLGTAGFLCDLSFHDIVSTSTLNFIVNNGSSVNGGFVGKDSLAPTLRTLLDGISSQKLNTKVEMFLVEGTPSSHSVLYKYNNVQGLTYRKVGNDVQLTISLENPLELGIYYYELFLSFAIRHGHNILLYGKCGAGGVNTTSLYWPKSRRTKLQQR